MGSDFLVGTARFLRRSVLEDGQEHVRSESRAPFGWGITERNLSDAKGSTRITH